MRKVYFLIFIALIALFFWGGILADKIFYRSRERGKQPPAAEEPQFITAKIAAAGDVMIHDSQIRLAHLGNNRYDFTPSFELISPLLQAADLSTVVLESCQAGPETGYTGYPAFNAPLELAEALAEAGFGLVSLANNHALDRGLDGLKATIEHLRTNGIAVFGAHLNRAERNNPVKVNLNGIEIIFLSYTYSTNGIPVPEGHEYAINYIDHFHTLQPILDDLERARADEPDLIAVYMHWGNEYQFEPTGQQREIARTLAEAGADLILGSHPHVVQPIEWLAVNNNSRERLVPVAYSLGNFLSDQFYWPPYVPTPAVQYGLLINILVEKELPDGDTRIKSFEYEIVWVHRNWGHRILPLGEVLAGPPEQFNLTPEQQRELQEGFRWIQSILENP